MCAVARTLFHVLNWTRSWVGPKGEEVASHPGCILVRSGLATLPETWDSCVYLGKGEHLEQHKEKSVRFARSQWFMEDRQQSLSSSWKSSGKPPRLCWTSHLHLSKSSAALVDVSRYRDWRLLSRISKIIAVINICFLSSRSFIRDDIG